MNGHACLKKEKKETNHHDCKERSVIWAAKVVGGLSDLGGIGRKRYKGFKKK